MNGFEMAAIAMAVILSAIVRIVRTDACWKAVDEGYATAEHLRDLTGIFKRSDLQDVIGLPTLDGVFHVTREDVERARRPTGYLMGHIKLDTAALGVAVIGLVWKPYGFVGDLLNAGIILAALYQISGWIVSFQLLNDRS